MTAAPLGVRASTPMRRSICISSAVLLAALAFAQVALAKAPPRGINDVYVVHFIVDGTHLFVAAGIGAANPPLRVYCRPDIFVVDILPDSNG